MIHGLSLASITDAMHSGFDMCMILGTWIANFKRNVSQTF